MKWLIDMIKAFINDLSFLDYHQRKQTGVGFINKTPVIRSGDAKRSLYGNQKDKKRSTMSLEEAHRYMGSGPYSRSRQKSKK